MKIYLNKIRIVSCFLMFCFIVLCVFATSKAGVIALTEQDYNNAMNVQSRLNQDKLRYNTVMGDILDCNYMSVMHNEKIIDEGVGEYHKSYSHLLGSVGTHDGGLLDNNYYTLTDKDADDINKNKGYSLVLTINDELQRYCYELTQGSRCSVVVLSRHSGRLLALTSTYKQDFNLGAGKPDDKTLKTYNNCSEPVWMPEYLNAYPPGSTMKIFSACVACENDMADYVIDDIGYYECRNGVRLYNNNGVAHGEGLDLASAFRVSSNSYFASLFRDVGVTAIRDTSKGFMFNDSINTDFGTVSTVFSFGDYTDVDICSLGYGQGKLMLSSVSVAMMTQGALEGKIYRPHVIDSVCYYDENAFVTEHKKIKEDMISGNIVTKKTSAMVEELMYQTATGEQYDLPDIITGAKTGTADLPDGTNRANIVGVNEDYIVVISRIDDDAYGIENRSMLIEVFYKLADVT